MSTEAYAIIQTGGKQYRVSKDDIIDVEMVDVEPGEKVEFSEVLFVRSGEKAQVGTPTVNGCTVTGEMLAIAPGPKVTSMKYKRRKNQHTKWGHRQKYSRVKITDIGAGTAAPKAKKEAAEEKPKAEAKPKAESKPKAAPKKKTTEAKKED